MASLRKKDLSQFWFACFSLPNGKRVQRSTKETKRGAAQKKADEWEQLAKERTKARQAHKVIADIYRAAHQQELPDSTPRTFVTGWLNRRKGELAATTHLAYKGTGTRFVEWLGEHADRPLAELEAAHFAGFRDQIAETRSNATANHAIKILRVVFEDARREGFVAENPSKDVGSLKKSKRSARRPFTLEELQKVIAAADTEMRSMILFGLYTGQRLSDIARLTWQNLDMVAREVTLVTAKTARVVRIPIAQPLLEHVAGLPQSDDPKAAIHPRADRSSQTTNSNRFADLLASVGLVSSRRHDIKKARGRSGPRAASELSFHSLRHTATSLLKNAGVSPAIVQDIIGHDSAAVSANYTHIDSESKRLALEKIPDVRSASSESQRPCAK
jgi:integrase